MIGEGFSASQDTSFIGDGGVIGESDPSGSSASYCLLCGEGHLNGAYDTSFIGDGGAIGDSEPSGSFASYCLFCGEGHLNGASGAGMIQHDRGTHSLHNLDTDDRPSLNGYG